MTEQTRMMLSKWLFVICGVVAFLVMFGGFVRLTRSGLSIVEWNVVSGVIPPIGEQAWEEEFAKYQQTPEFQLINYNMTLEGFKKIFLIEYIHRLIARLAGLAYALPALWFLFRRIVPWRQSAPIVIVGLLFAFQGFMGWYMVSSGLVDRPHVSHFRLTAHLLVAILILGVSFWMGLSLRHPDERRGTATDRTSFRLALIVLATLLIQIMYGGFVAGLKAGYLSTTFPLMGGKWIPEGLFGLQASLLENLTSHPLTVHFIHRWFAFVVWALALWLFLRLRTASAALQRGGQILLAVASLQILLGVSVVLFGVPIWLAIAHQGNALAIFVAVLYVLHRLRAQPA